MAAVGGVSLSANTTGSFTPVVETVEQRVSKVYAYAAFGLALTAISAFVFAKIGFTATLLSTLVASPTLAVIFLGAIGIGLVAATILLPKEKSVLKHGAYGLYSVFQGLVLSPLVLLNPASFGLAAGGAAALTGGLGVLAMHLKENFERYERILMVGLGAIALASFGVLCLPAVPALIAEKISLYGGFALFSTLIIYDTHRARDKAHLSDFDPIAHSMSIYQDSLNLLIRFWQFTER